MNQATSEDWDGFESEEEKEQFLQRSRETFRRFMEDHTRKRLHAENTHAVRVADCDLCREIQEDEDEAERFAIEFEHYLETLEDKDNA